LYRKNQSQKSKIMETLLYDENETLVFTDLDTKFTYEIEALVSSDYDGYRPIQTHHFKLTVDPSSTGPKIEVYTDIDNEHGNCRHFHGYLHSVYSRAYQTGSGEKVPAKLSFIAWWDRTCGSTGFSNMDTFSGEVKEGTSQLNYNDTVRVDVKFKVVK
jgi:hypothetical protein